VKGKVAITVNPTSAKRFSVHVRVPDRGVSRLYTNTPDANGLTSLGGQRLGAEAEIMNGYAVITRTGSRDRSSSCCLSRSSACAPSRRSRRTEERSPSGTAADLQHRASGSRHCQGGRSRCQAGRRVRPDLLGGVVVITGRFATAARC